MIDAELVLDEAGLIRSCLIEGHAGAEARGGDVVCAAVSILARTALRTLSEKEGVSVIADAPARGVLGFVLEKAPSGDAFLAGVTAFLVEGLDSVARDYPNNCCVRIRTERRHHNGD